MERGSVDKFKKISEMFGADFKFEVAGNYQYGDCHISKGVRNIFISFVKYEDQYIAYGMTADIAPSELYLDIKNDDYENRIKRQNDILQNLKRLLGDDLRYVKKPSIFNESRGYIEIPIEGSTLKVMQKKNIWNLSEV